jgi:opacity protein-like surface antigen
MKTRNLLLLLIVVGLSLPATATAQARHQRGSWYIGFGLGGALAAQWDANGQTVSFNDWLDGYDKDPKVSANFKVGVTLSPRTLVGFDLTGVAQSSSLNGLDATAQINNLFLMLTHFPNQEGFFVRAGGGVSKILRVVETPSGEVSSDASGSGVLAGIGYAFWLGKSFNLTLNLDQSFQWYSNDPGEPDRSQFTTLYMGFDWY